MRNLKLLAATFVIPGLAAFATPLTARAADDDKDHHDHHVHHEHVVHHDHATNMERDGKAPSGKEERSAAADEDRHEKHVEHARHHDHVEHHDRVTDNK